MLHLYSVFNCITSWNCKLWWVVL